MISTLILSCTAQNQPKDKQNKNYQIAFYNVENLFDTINAPGKRDGEYTPSGAKEWDTEKYKQKAFNNPFIHLTNYAINKDNANYQTDENAEASTGHKRSLNSIYVKLGQDGVNVEALKAKMRDMIVKTLISIQPDLIHHYRTS